jgi:diguanylate cyclase (GGDEF)-like protein/PAS domain S-box-containing protein
LKKLSWLSEHGYQVLLDRLQDGIFAIEDGKLIYVNQRLATMLGYPLDELINRPFLELVAVADRPLVSERHQARLAGKKVPENYDMRLLTSSGAEILCSLNVGLGETRVGGTVTVGSVRDVTEQRAAQDELEKSKADLKSIFDKLPDVLYRTDMNGIIIMVSPSCFDIIGYRPEELLGTVLSDYYYVREDRQDVVQAALDSGGKATQIEARLKHKNGKIIWFWAKVSVHYGPDGKPAYIEGLARDVSERKQMEEQLVARSRTDELTGASNRRYFLDKSEDVICMMKRYQRPVSMMIADLDNFKMINDNYGHHAGDLALKAFAEICLGEIRESDIFGRLGGEEFGLMLPETTIQEAHVLAERILSATNALEISLDGKAIRFTVSIGLIELDADDTSLNKVMHRADLAMYQAKAQGRNQIVTATN